MVHVVDTGIGINEKDVPLLFSKFGKLLRTAHMNSEGIGLGLMISKALVEHNEGQINAFSEGINKGSVFIFSMSMDTSLHPSIEQAENEIEEEIKTHKIDSMAG